MNKKYFIFPMLLVTLYSCSFKINQNFNYQQVIKPEEIRVDVDKLKKDLEKKHFDINWEGKKESYFNQLDNIKLIDRTITIDSFENRIRTIVNALDDGHSRVIHQGSPDKINRNAFGVNPISESILYLRIGNFMDNDELKKTLEKFKTIYNEKKPQNIIIDIRDNPGGNIQNVNRVLSHLIPSHTKLYEKVEVKPVSKMLYFHSKLASARQDLKHFKYTSKKKINGSPKIFLWINENIASGSMLLSYHLQKNGAIVLGQSPKGLFNTFGNAVGYRLPHSKIAYALAKARVYVTDGKVVRMDDMITPNVIPDADWKLSDLITYINEYVSK